MSTPGLDDFTITEEEIASPNICESDHCNEVLKKPSHEATLYGHFPCCWFMYAICRERAEMFLDQRVTCNCGKTVDGTTITVTEIPK